MLDGPILHWRDQALVELNDRFEAAGHLADLAFIAAEILGRTLNVSRAGYGTIDMDYETILIERDWNAPGVSSIAGTLNFRDHGSYIEDLKRGDTATVVDAYLDPRTYEAADVLAAIDARSFINMPVTEHGRFVALIFVNHNATRNWAADEIAFMRDLGQRTRVAVERRRTELRLQDSERRLGTALAIAQLGTCEWEIASDQLTIDARTREIFGFLSNEQVTAEMMLARIHREDIDRVRAVTNAAIANPGRLQAEYRILLPNGVVNTVVSTNDFLIDADGMPLRTMGVFEDITRRRQTEVELRTLNETLETRVAERTQELEKAQEALRQSQKLEAIGQLTGGFAHDFNNLLTVIGGSADLLQRSDLPEAKRERYVARISSTVVRAANLTSQLLAFARRQPLKPEQIDGRDTARTAALVASSTIATGIKVELKTPAQACLVHVDPTQLANAVANLVTNASEAMGNTGTLSLSIGAVDGIPPVRGHAFRPGAFIAITIRDTGHGIASENLGRIFEPFYSTKAVGQGSGLGLSQVFGFAKQSGGDVSVESLPGHGACFTLFLPRPDAPLASVTALSASHKVAHDGCVLVVEDNPDVREFAVTMLTELGYATVEAPDGRVALDELAKGGDRFDLVFSDVMMPGMSGVELGREVRHLYPGVRVVLTSGYSDALADDELDFDLVKKPYSMSQLAKVLLKSLA